MGELKEEHKDIEFHLLSAGSEAGIEAAVKYDFGKSRHGIVGLDADGERVFRFPGHFYGKDDIKEELE